MGVCVDPDSGLTYDEFGRLAVDTTAAVRIRNSVSQSIPDGSGLTVVTMDDAEFNPGGMVFDDTSVVIRSAGLYLVAFNGALVGDDDYRVARVELWRAVGGTGGAFAVFRRGPDVMPVTLTIGTVNPALQLFEVAQLAEDDRLQVQVGQQNDAAEARNLLFSGVASANLTVAKLVPRV